MISKKGAGSCDAVSSETGPDMYLMAYKKAMAEICADRRITVADKIILENLFSEQRGFSMRNPSEEFKAVVEDILETGVIKIPVSEPEIEPVIEPVTEFVVDESRFGDQMELFG